MCFLSTRIGRSTPFFLLFLLPVLNFKSYLKRFLTFLTFFLLLLLLSFFFFLCSLAVVQKFSTMLKLCLVGQDVPKIDLVSSDVIFQLHVQVPAIQRLLENTKVIQHLKIQQNIVILLMSTIACCVVHVQLNFLTLIYQENVPNVLQIGRINQLPFSE